MNITILCIGKAKTAWYDGVIDEYLRRITRPFSVTVEVLSPAAIDDEARSKSVEAEQIIKKLRDTDTVILLEESGKQYDSVGFAAYLDRLRSHIPGRLVLVMGGAYGIGDTVRTQAQSSISLSPMTLPHELARLVLVEQLYRATTILQNGKYHH